MSSQTNKIAWDSFPKHWYFTLFYTAWDVVELAFVWFFYPETKGPTLEEIARIFDGDKAVARIDLHEIAKGIYGEYEEDVTYDSYMPRRGNAARRYYSERR